MSENPVLEPISIGALKLPNRVVMTTVKLGYATKEGMVTDRHVAFYGRRAEGDVGLLTTEPLYVRSDGRELPTQMGIHQDAMMGGLTRIVREVHDKGGRMMAHLNHAGRAANPKLVGEGALVSASDVPCPANQGTPRPLATEEIREIVQAFGDAARRAREAGFDAVEIPFSHGYLIHQFLSPYSNRREDAYGGSFENRLRFGMEVLEAVKGEAGTGVPVVIRMNAVDYVDGGLTLDDAISMAGALSEGGADALSITSGTMCETVPFCLYPAGTPQAHLLPMAARIREASSVPVIVAGRIRTPAVARMALEAGQTDLVGLGRPFLADPDWVRKVREGDEEGILLCPACHQGCLGALRAGEGTGCLVNPLTGKEDLLRAEPAGSPKKVAVVGGGPAGLEAAWVAASRGHHVSLYEEKESFGGQLALAARVPHKEGFLDVIHQLTRMAQRAGVSIHTGARMDAQKIMTLRPDAVIIATGGVPLTRTFPGLEDSPWALAGDILDGAVEPRGPSVLVVGGGLVGLEAADFLSAQGKEVTLVEIVESVGEKLDPLPRAMLLKRLKEQGVDLHTSTKVERLTEGLAVLSKGNEEIQVRADMVVLAVGVQANTELADALEDRGMEIHAIGDAKEPRGVGEAILEGFEAGAGV